MVSLLSAPIGPKAALVHAASSLGYELTVTETTLRYAAVAALGSHGRSGPRAVMAWVSEAARSRLIRALRSDAPTSERIVISPDDLSVARGSQAGPDDDERFRGGIAPV